MEAVPIIDIRERVETTTGHIEFEFTLNCDRVFTYAIYGRALDGLKLTNVYVTIRPGGEGLPVIVRRELAPAPLSPAAEGASAPDSSVPVAATRPATQPGPG